jgi:hypothetical protein
MRVPFATLFAEHPNRKFSPISSPVKVGGDTIFSGRMLDADFLILGRKIGSLPGHYLEVDVGPGDVQTITKVY